MNDITADLVIIGSGPAGLAAACEARTLNLSVTVLDEQIAAGGQIYRNIESAPRERIDVLGKDYEAGRRLAAEFRKSGADRIGGAMVWNISSEGVVDYVTDGRSKQATGKAILIAGGAMERPFPIRGWTLPGVMGAGAAQILLKSAGAMPREPVVLAGGGPLLYLLAWQYLRAGVKIAALVDTTEMSGYWKAARYAAGAVKGWHDLFKGLKLIGTLRANSVAIYSGATNLAIEGDCRVEAITFSQRSREKRIATRLILLHQGVVPNTQLSWAVGARHHWDTEQLCWLPDTDASGRLGEMPIYVAGDSRGIVGAQASAAQGRLTALSIAERLGQPVSGARRAELKASFDRYTSIRTFLNRLYRPADANRIPAGADVVVCRCEEVTAGQIRRYVELGCLGPNQTKAFGRCGMGPCQGRFCGLTVTEIIAQERKVKPNEVGYYRVRPPIKPVTLGDFAQ